MFVTHPHLQALYIYNLTISQTLVISTNSHTSNSSYLDKLHTTPLSRRSPLLAVAIARTDIEHSLLGDLPNALRDMDNVPPVLKELSTHLVPFHDVS